jgi:hypothetical protein
MGSQVKTFCTHSDLKVAQPCEPAELHIVLHSFRLAGMQFQPLQVL